MRELYFLCSRATAPEGPEWAGSLLTVNASGSESMYLAGTTRALAERLLVLFPVPQVTVLAASELLSKYHVDFLTRRVVVIESEVELAQFVKDRGAFPFERHAISYRKPD